MSTKPALSRRPLLGIACMVASCGAASLNDVAIKWIVNTLPIGELLCLRAVATLLGTALLARRDGGLRAVRVHNFGGQLLQAVLSAMAMLLFVMSLRSLPLADAIALLFAGPLMAIVLAAILLGETVGWRRWSAVVIGFMGVLIILRPGADSFTAAAILPVGAAAAGALRDIVTRRLCASESSTSVVVVTTIVMIAGTSTTAPFGWIWPTPGQLVLIAFAGLAITATLYLSIESLRFGDVALVSPFRYTTMVWAVLLGYLFFGTIPDPWVTLGSILVVGSGLYVLHRELVLRPSPGGA